MTINDILSHIRAISLTEKDKGTEFERIMQRWFLSDPRYNNLEKVWLWEEFPSRKDLGGTDLGIDLVARTDTGDYWAIQCKCYAEDAPIDKGAVNSFLANASRTFLDPDTMQTREFSNLVWVSTSRKKWGENAEKAVQNLSKPFNRINLTDLENSAVDWDKIVHGKEGKEAQLSGKHPLPHQVKAIEKARQHYVDEKETRGKLIMACGTGKTYTSLKIMEDITDKHALVLFLVPSIALLGQTLNAWMADKNEDIRAICVCSDSKATRKMIDADEEDESVVDLAVPASTNVKKALHLLNKYLKEDCRTVIFSTYQSIDVVSDVLHQSHCTVDLCICDEAHRTTGVKINGQDESNFTKIHSDDNVPAKRRLYMTATPRLYRESVKVKAAENDDILCSMDDEKIYGKEFYRLTFNEAVSKGLLTDYKVLVLTVSENDIPKDISHEIAKKYSQAEGKDKLKELNFDDATKLIGCINGLSKRIKGDDGITLQQDPIKMKRAVAFCQTINPTRTNPNASSTQIAAYFSTVCDAYKKSLTEEEAKDVVNVRAQHIDGSMDANTRNEKLAWLKEDADDPNECRVLCNVRCLSEGVDVPALDAVLFLSPRNSEVEVVQSVGRIMRTFGKGTDHEKKYGYIIIPIIVPDDVKPEDALNDNDRFKVVWTILNALRSHDENFNAHINQINLNKKRPPKIVVGGVPRGQYSLGSNADDQGKAVTMDNGEVGRQLDLRFGTLQDGIYARIVNKVGDKMYWENWSKEIGQIAIKFIDRIAKLVEENAGAKKSFGAYLKGLQKNINPSVNKEQGIEMLAQHMITKPIFDALFKDYQFVKSNVVSRSMQHMIDILQREGFEMDTEVLDKFYTSVKNNVSSIDNLEGKQTIIKNIYEKFFKGAFPKTVDTLGIVYTPIECVDFIIFSVDAILRREFGTALTNENVHFLDPFTGTGSFVTRLLQLGVIKSEDMRRKYLKEIHCNEIVLLAYYIADVNIEAVYQELMKPKEYLPFDGICLTDTFQMTENSVETSWTDKTLEENFKRVGKLMKTPVQVICSNPPYSGKQKSGNDNAQNMKYSRLDMRIKETFAKDRSTTNINVIYDPYIRAFRWALDKISRNPEGGIVAFITNSGWIDKPTFEGFRKSLAEEVSSMYVIDLRGAIKGKSGEAAKREGQNIFDIMTGVAITILVKNPKSQEKHAIKYYNIGDYLKKEQKLNILTDFHSVTSDKINWTNIHPNEYGDWINLRNSSFASMLPIFPEKKFNVSSQSFFYTYSLGLATGRDSWVYNYSLQLLKSNVQLLANNYNNEVARFEKEQPASNSVDQWVNNDPTKISWNRNLKQMLVKCDKISIAKNHFISALQRPFCCQSLYFDKQLNAMMYQNLRLFPAAQENIIICVSGISSRLDSTSVLISNKLVDLNLLDSGTQCFPLYWYEENKNKQKSLFDGMDDDNDYIRHDGITDWILKEARKRYHAKNITKEHIFYYVYGLLHSKDYRERFAADLKKSLPRIPLVDGIDDFMSFYKAGRKLAELHLNYESVEPYSGVVVSGDKPLTHTDDDYEFYRIPDKMRFKSKQDKSVIYYNGHIIISNIPEKAYEYIVNGKSAIEWIVERYAVTVDKASLIKNDCNDWAKEHHKPRYILDLLLSVINMSVQTVDIVNSLPTVSFE
jgi:predicted helicase